MPVKMPNRQDSVQRVSVQVNKPLVSRDGDAESADSLLNELGVQDDVSSVSDHSSDLVKEDSVCSRNPKRTGLAAFAVLGLVVFLIYWFAIREDRATSMLSGTQYNAPTNLKSTDACIAEEWAKGDDYADYSSCESRRRRLSGGDSCNNVDERGGNKGIQYASGGDSIHIRSIERCQDEDSGEAVLYLPGDEDGEDGAPIVSKEQCEDDAVCDSKCVWSEEHWDDGALPLAWQKLADLGTFGKKAFCLYNLSAVLLAIDTNCSEPIQDCLSTSDESCIGMYKEDAKENSTDPTSLANIKECIEGWKPTATYDQADLFEYSCDFVSAFEEEFDMEKPEDGDGDSDSEDRRRLAEADAYCSHPIVARTFIGCMGAKEALDWSQFSVKMRMGKRSSSEDVIKAILHINKATTHEPMADTQLYVNLETKSHPPTGSIGDSSILDAEMQAHVSILYGGGPPEAIPSSPENGLSDAEKEYWPESPVALKTLTMRVGTNAEDSGLLYCMERANEFDPEADLCSRFCAEPNGEPQSCADSAACTAVGGTWTATNADGLVQMLTIASSDIKDGLWYMNQSDVALAKTKYMWSTFDPADDFNSDASAGFDEDACWRMCHWDGELLTFDNAGAKSMSWTCGDTTDYKTKTAAGACDDVKEDLKITACSDGSCDYPSGWNGVTGAPFLSSEKMTTDFREIFTPGTGGQKSALGGNPYSDSEMVTNLPAGDFDWS